MTENNKIFVAVAIFGAALLAGVAIRVLIPYYQQEQDNPMETASRHEAKAILDAIYQFAERNQENRFPESLNDVTPIVLSNRETPVTASNIDTVYRKFVYFQPPPHKLESVMTNTSMRGKVILLEKLGYYKHREGGYGGTAGQRVQWYHLEAYKRLIATNGISLEQVSR